MKIHRPNPQILIITKSRLSAIGLLSFLIAFFGFWYYYVLQLESIPEGAQPFDYIIACLFAEPTLWLAVLAPVVALPTMYKSLRIVTVGEQLFFDGTKRAIFKNNKLLVKFGEVAHLQSETISGEADEYRLIAVLRGKGLFRKIKIHTSGGLDEIIILADELADIVKITVFRKN
jgi:hypothetical protein